MNRTIAVVLSGFLLAGCERQPQHVCITVPTGYTGVFAIKIDPTHGMSVIHTDRCFLVSIPESGLLLVDKASFLYDWHSTEVTFDDGTSVPYIYASQDVAGAGTVACWGMYSSHDDMHYYYIGTKAGRSRTVDLSRDELKKHWLQKQ